jgi:hypothetical protein
MTEATPTGFGAEHARVLLEAGWRQCQVFRPTKEINRGVEGEDIYFVVCTQSCTVVSPCLIRDPFVELAIGRPVTKFNFKSHESRGRNVRRFHLPVSGIGFEALEIDINSRRFVNRELLLKIDYARLQVADDARRDFAAWIARSYSRIALPTQLVKQLKTTILKKLEGFLEEKIRAETFSLARHNLINSIWIRFKPDAELSGCDLYEVKLLIICDEPEIVEEYDRELLKRFGSQSVTVDHFSFSFDVNSLDGTLLSDLNGWQRFTEWDYLSGMGEAASTPEG